MNAEPAEPAAGQPGAAGQPAVARSGESSRRGESGRLSVALDATPLLGARTGIGRYVQHLVAALARSAELRSVTAAAFTWHRREGLRDSVPAAVRIAGRRAPARGLQALWSRSDWPPAEWLTGAVDVVHGTNFVLPPVHRATGVVTVHDLAYLHSPGVVSAASLRYRDLVPRGLRRAAMTLTPSQAVADELIEAYGLSPDKVTVTPLGVDPAWSVTDKPTPAWLSALGMPTDYIVAVGTREPRKGLDVLLAAYADLLAAEPAAPKLVVIGPAGWGPELQIASLPPDRVVVPGYLPEDTLRRVVAGARLLAYPSRYEGFGLPPLEAMAASVPVVASDLAAVREATGGLVRLVPPGQVDALTEALLAELTTPTPVDQLIAARDHALDHTWTRCADLTIAAYYRAVG